MKPQTQPIVFGQEQEGLFMTREDCVNLASCLEEIIKNFRYCADIPASDVMYLNDIIRTLQQNTNKQILKNWTDCLDEGPEILDWLDGRS